MNRKLFCEISPFTYRLSTKKCIFLRHVNNIFYSNHFASNKISEPLPFLIYNHKSLIRRKLGNVDLSLQNNKAINLSLSTPKVSGIIIEPNEVFSFWNLVGKCTKQNGYHEGLTIQNGSPSSGMGGGMCQFTNLIHWMILHTPLEIIEHHHHDGIDLFPDYGRQIPFGTGTSILYNYLDYRFKNTTHNTFQLITYTTNDYLCGEVRAKSPLNVKYHIKVENEFFSKEDNIVYRNNEIYRECIDVHTGNLISRELIKANHAKVMYDVSKITVKDKNYST